jgi:hypothetical protein
MSLPAFFCAGSMLEERHKHELKKRDSSCDFATINGVPEDIISRTPWPRGIKAYGHAR